MAHVGPCLIFDQNIRIFRRMPIETTNSPGVPDIWWGVMADTTFLITNIETAMTLPPDVGVAKSSSRCEYCS